MAKINPSPKLRILVDIFFIIVVTVTAVVLMLDWNYSQISLNRHLCKLDISIT